MTEKEKIIQIVYETGMSFEDARNSWALKNWEESRVLARFFDSFKNQVREITNPT